VTAVQFNHRMVAYLIVAVALWQAISIVRTPSGADLRASVVMLAGAIVAQALLGIWTLLAHVPLTLGLAHQGVAAVVTGLAVWHVFVVSRGNA
jgi:cytochrome c oxidase assembly protein subunit 15